MLLMLGHHFFARYLSLQSQEKFFNKSPDLIAVFTGDRGRIKEALEVSLKHPTSKILISGVYSKNNLAILLKNHFPTQVESERFDLLARVTELDFQAQNTFQNVQQTLGFLKDQKSLQEVLIISSDYHLPRIDLILWKLETNSKYSFYYQGIKSQTFVKSVELTFWEVLKTLKDVLKFNF